MLRIILNKRSNESGVVKQLPPETVRVACPNHLVLADLPVAESLGSVNPASAVKIVGRRSLRPPSRRVKFCIRCDFPIAVYGRLSPCEHIFCLDCAKSDALCYIWRVKRFANNIVIYRGYAAGDSIWGTISCDECIQKIQTIQKLEEVYICAAPYCFKSFLNKTEFESHIHENHSDLLVKIAEKDDYISESASAKKPATSESTLQAPTRSIFSPSSSSQVHDREDKAHNALTRDQQPPRPFMQQKPPFTGSIKNHPLEQQYANPRSGFERPGMQYQLLQQGCAQGSLQPDPGHFPDKQQGIVGSFPFPEYPMGMPQPHGFAVPMSSNSGLAPQFGYPPFAPDGPQPFYSAASFEMPRPDSTRERGSEQGSLLVFAPGAAGNVNFPANYPRPWNMGQPVGPFESAAVQPTPDGFVNAADSQGRAILFEGEYGRNASVVPSNLPPPPSARGLEGGQSSHSKDTRDSKGILMRQPMSLPPPPPPPPLPHQMSLPPPPPPPPLPHQMSQLQIGGRRYSGNTSHDGQGYGWQHDKGDDFRSSQH